MAMARIYEFSTGITLENQNGQWVSKGFQVGEYMNQTIPNIPKCVERAIANKLFEVSKNSQSPEPTIVGRVVPKTPGELDWSVVAIVTTGIDNYQRHTGLYRYFLCEGADSLWKIAAYLEDYRRQYRQFPVHHPAEVNRTKKPIDYDCVKSPDVLSRSSEWQEFLNNSQTPSLLKPERKYDLNFINAMAEYKAGTESQPHSWAWNVEAIENPAYFLVIQAASQTAYNLLNNTRQSQVSQPRPVGPGVDIAGIESAIKGLINGGSIKQEWIQTVVQAKQQNQLTQPEWEKIFNDLGANSRSFSPNTVRLLTLRAIILPKTLPHYLQYLDIKKPDQNPNQQQQTSLQFQSQIRTYRNSLNSWLSEGAISVAELIGHYKKMEYVPAVAWLFDGTQPGLWLTYKTKFVSKVQEYFKNAHSTRKEYDSLEKLFKEWGTPLYTYSYAPRSRGGTRQEPENISLVERLRSNIFEVIVQGLVLVIFLILVAWIIKPDKLAFAYVLIYAIASGLIRVFLNKDQIDNALKILGLVFTILVTFIALHLLNHVWAGKGVSENSTASGTNNSARKNDGQGANSKATPNNRPLVSMTNQERKDAIARFDDTRQSLKKIVDDLKVELDRESQLTINEHKNIVIAALLETLGMEIDIQQYQNVIEGAGGTRSQKEKWIEAIYLYQQKSVSDLRQGYGYIKPDVKTTTDALKRGIKSSPLFQFFTKTRVALQPIFGELDQVKKILKNDQLDYSGAVQKGNTQHIKTWIEAIKEYQQRNGLDADGIIAPDGPTYKKLKEDLDID